MVSRRPAAFLPVGDREYTCPTHEADHDDETAPQRRAGRDRLHAREARPPARRSPRRPLGRGPVRRPPGADAGGAARGRGDDERLPRLRTRQARPAGLRVRFVAATQQRSRLADPDRPATHRRASRGRLLRRRGLPILPVEPPPRGLHGPSPRRRLTVPTCRRVRSLEAHRVSPREGPGSIRRVVATTSEGSPEDRTPQRAPNHGAAPSRGDAPAASRRSALPTRAGSGASGTSLRGAHARRPAAKRTGGRGEDGRGFFRRRWWLFALAPVALGLFGLAVLWIAYVRIDLPKALPPVQTTVVTDRGGELLSTIHGAVDRTLIPFRQMPEHTRDAVIAVEDARFYEHSGVDLKGTIRAAWADLVAGEAVQGGSTITQQLVKRIYAGHYTEPGENGIRDYVIPPRTVKEKVREVL